MEVVTEEHAFISIADGDLDDLAEEIKSLVLDEYEHPRLVELLGAIRAHQDAE